jgi:NTF2-related export protein 1/2
VRVQLPEDLERILLAQRRMGENGQLVPVTHEIESLDVHIGNADYRLGASPEILANLNATAGQRLMLLVSVDGTVKYGGKPDADVKAFHENFILVPNWETLVQQRPNKNSRKYLVISQNFRRRG